MNREAEELAHGVGRGDPEAIKASAGWATLTDIKEQSALGKSKDLDVHSLQEYHCRKA